MRTGLALGRVALATTALTLLPLAHASAQRGGGGGGGRGSDAGFGGGRAAQRAPRLESGPEDMTQRFERQFEEMGSLKAPLKDVKLEKDAKDSVSRIEKTYKQRLRDYGKSTGKLLEAARSSGAPPEPGAMGRVRSGAQAMQDEEYAEVRKLLSDEQRAAFDKNVVDMRAEMQKRMEERRGGGERP